MDGEAPDKFDRREFMASVRRESGHNRIVSSVDEQSLNYVLGHIVDALQGHFADFLQPSLRSVVWFQSR